MAPPDYRVKLIKCEDVMWMNGLAASTTSLKKHLGKIGRTYFCARISNTGNVPVIFGSGLEEEIFQVPLYWLEKVEDCTEIIEGTKVRVIAYMDAFENLPYLEEHLNKVGTVMGPSHMSTIKGGVPVNFGTETNPAVMSVPVRWLCVIETEEKSVKPPLGLTPRYIHDEQRRDEIIDAMSVYIAAGRRIPIEWVQEYNELIKVPQDKPQKG